MSNESPEGRAWREQRTAEKAAESDGVYTKERLVQLFGADEMAFDEILAIVAAGKITYRPRPYAADTTDYLEVEANSSVEPFSLLEGMGLTAEQVQQLYDAEDAAFPKNVPPETIEDLFRVGRRDAYDYRYYQFWPDTPERTAVARDHRGIVERWQPESRVWVEVPFDYDKVYGQDKSEARPIGYLDAVAMAQSGEGLFEMPLEDVTRQQESLDAETAERAEDPYYG
jgi:hypothetical protein